MLVRTHTQSHVVVSRRRWSSRGESAGGGESRGGGFDENEVVDGRRRCLPADTLLRGVSVRQRSSPYEAARRY